MLRSPARSNLKNLYLNVRPEQVENERRLKRMSAVITLVLGALLLLAAWSSTMMVWLNLLAFRRLEGRRIPLASWCWGCMLGTRECRRCVKRHDCWGRPLSRPRHV
ncbi:sodium:solute symporter family transporter [Shigella flexneri]